MQIIHYACGCAEQLLPTEFDTIDHVNLRKACDKCNLELSRIYAREGHVGPASILLPPNDRPFMVYPS